MTVMCVCSGLDRRLLLPWRDRPRRKRRPGATRPVERRDSGDSRHGQRPLRQSARPPELAARAAPCCVNTVAEVMRAQIAAKTAEVPAPRTRPQPAGRDRLLERAFDPAAASGLGGRLHRSFPTREGWLCLATVPGPVLTWQNHVRLGDERPNDEASWWSNALSDSGSLPAPQEELLALGSQRSVCQ